MTIINRCKVFGVYMKIISTSLCIYRRRIAGYNEMYYRENFFNIRLNVYLYHIKDLNSNIAVCIQSLLNLSEETA